MSKNYNIGGDSFQRVGYVRNSDAPSSIQLGREIHDLVVYLTSHMEDCQDCKDNPASCEIAMDLREQYHEMRTALENA
jgi:hypothetical protein